MRALDPDKIRPVMQLWISAIFLTAGFAVLLFGVGEQSSARLAAGWVGAVLGFWLR